MKLTVNEYNFFTSEKVNLKFAFVSDLHDCKNEPILNAIPSTGADAVLVGGDFIQ